MRENRRKNSGAKEKLVKIISMMILLPILTGALCYSVYAIFYAASEYREPVIHNNTLSMREYLSKRSIDLDKNYPHAGEVFPNILITNKHNVEVNKDKEGYYENHTGGGEVLKFVFSKENLDNR